MIPSYESDPVGVADFIGEKQQEGLDGVVSTVDEVAHEEVVGLWTEATDFEKLHHVPELTMYVTAYLRAKEDYT